MEILIKCNGWQRFGDLYIIIPRHDQGEFVEDWAQRYIDWLLSQSLEPSYMMAMANGLEAQAKAHQLNPLERNMKDKLDNIMGVAYDGIRKNPE